jgi:hypothetical protein
MHQLTGLDAAFLTLESPTAYGHAGNVSVLDPPAGGEAHYGNPYTLFLSSHSQYQT